MDNENIIVEIGEDFVAAVTLNRPDKLNAFNTPLAEALAGTLAALDEDPSVRVVLIRGAGKAFCVGIDINEVFGKSAQQYREWIERMEAPLVGISQMKKPVIAQVHGVAAANGMGLVAAADLAIAAENARMGLTAINVGLNCVGPVLPVSRSVGRKRAMELLLFGELIRAPQALEMGIINKTTPLEELEGEARRWAADLARRSPVAVQIAKKAFYSSEDLDYQRAFEFMNEAFARLCATDDAKEGVQAFLDKRKPEWKGM